MAPGRRWMVGVVVSVALGATACGGRSVLETAAGGATGSANGGGTGGGTSNGTCLYARTEHDPGTTFDAVDGCNICTCDPGGSGRVSCTMSDCAVCSKLVATYKSDLDQAKRCDPSRTEECLRVAPRSLACGCATFVVDPSSLYEVQADWNEAKCDVQPPCPECRVAAHGECSAEGVCVDVENVGTGPSCTFEYLGDAVRCEHHGWPNYVPFPGAKSTDDCFAACRDDPLCTGVTDYLFLGDPSLGCGEYVSSCDAPIMIDVNEDAGRDYRKVCNP